MRPLRNLCEVAVIGGGLAGLSAARQVARLGRLATLFEGSGLYGGQLATVNEVDGLPIAGNLSGQDLAIPLLEASQKVGVQIVQSNVRKIELDKGITLTDDRGQLYHPEAVIVASGASLRRLDVPGEEALAGRGVSTCASCDGGFYRGKDVAVIGGGDAAVHEALVLAPTSRRVVMVCRSGLKAKREYIDKLDARENVEFIWDSEVEEILGDDGVTGLRLRNVKDGTRSTIDCFGVFPFIGVAPNTGFLPGSMLDHDGLVKTGDGFAASDSRIFAVGAARTGYGGNAIEAMAEGTGAAASVARLLAA